MRTRSFFVLILVLASCVSSGTKKASAEAEEPLMTAANTEVTQIIRGRVVVFGSEPHTFAGIVAEDGRHYNITPPEKEKEIRKFQGYVINFTVIFLDVPVGPPGLALQDGTVKLLSWTIEE
jgi:hypothetical protein